MKAPNAMPRTPRTAMAMPAAVPPETLEPPLAAELVAPVGVAVTVDSTREF